VTLRVNNSSGKLKVVNGQGGRLRPNVDVEAVLPVAFGDLVAYYPFRQGTGVDVTAGDPRFGDTTDYSATVNGATFKPDSGVHDIQNGANSGAFDFDGADDTLDLGTVADSDQSFTVMTWVKPDTVNVTTRQRVITKNISGEQPSGSFLIDILSNGKARFLIGTGGSNSVIQSSQSLSQNQYVHITGRYGFSSGSQELFINGQSVASTSIGQLSAFSSQPWRIGEDDPVNISEFLNGTLDEARIYQAALSHSQIYQIYQNTRPATRLDKMAAHYTFNDGLGDDQTAGVSVSGDSTDYSGTVVGVSRAENEGVNDD
jgi:hypothetical protein